MTQTLLREIWQSIGGHARMLDAVTFTGDGDLPSALKVTDLAGASIASAGTAIAELQAAAGGTMAGAQVDRRLASFWFAWSLRPLDWEMPGAWDPIAGDYETRDGWIRLHTNAPHHRAAAQRVLGPHDDKPAMATAVKSWDKQALESAMVEAGGCAAEMRSIAEWSDHPQGRAVAGEALAHIVRTDSTASRSWKPTPGRPLAGLRVLDLTRVLAGPIATRFLAGFGADVLRIDPPDWDEPGVVPEVTLGKHCARLDLTRAQDRAVFDNLLRQADIMLHGYRAGALDGLGYSTEARQALSPGLVDVCLDAYGWSGPWQGRRGFDSLVQMSSGIAAAGMAWKHAGRPFPLPVQALDHATGYIMAATAIRALTARLADGWGTQARLSLARTAKLLVDAGPQTSAQSLTPETAADQAPAIEHTSWGEARRLTAPLAIKGAPMLWDRPASRLGSAEPAWA
jgi:hypothetical protein